MRGLLQGIILLAGILGGLYLGVYIMCFGGIVNVINAIKATPLDTTLLAIGILKFLFASVVGWITFWFSMVIAAVLE